MHSWRNKIEVTKSILSSISYWTQNGSRRFNWEGCAQLATERNIAISIKTENFICFVEFYDHITNYSASTSSWYQQILLYWKKIAAWHAYFQDAIITLITNHSSYHHCFNRVIIKSRSMIEHSNFIDLSYALDTNLNLSCYHIASN